MIRNFLYLDSDKLRSISSQLFEGVADSILQRDTEELAKSDSQKGPFGSGEVLADIIRKSSTSAQTKVLEDHAYTLLESEVAKAGKIVDANEQVDEISGFPVSFVRVTGRLEINDTQVLADILTGFNELGSDITRIVHSAELEARAPGKPINKREVEKLATTLGMQMDKEFSSSLARMIRFSSKGILEFQIRQSKRIFSAPLKREYLRESEALIVQKYSRYSEAQFTMFGITTQVGLEEGKPKPLSDVKDAENLKTALRNLSGHVRTIEDSFGGLTAGEVVLDPIAVYQTL